jgi:uncharacterized membrane protein YqhA
MEDAQNKSRGNAKPTTLAGWVEEIFESALYNCRFLVLFAVIGSAVASLTLFLRGTIEIIQGVNSFLDILNHFQPTPADDKNVILAFIPAIDNFLFATVLLIFSMGIYELFISQIDPSWKGPQTRPNWLKIEGLDDLKMHMSEVVVMILVISFFQESFSMTLSNPVDLLLLGGGIVLIAGALWITHDIMSRRKGKKNQTGLHHKTDLPIGAEPVSK